MLIKFYGVKGSIPNPMTNKDLENKLRKAIEISSTLPNETTDEKLKQLPFHISHTYGGNTPCIYVFVQGKHFIFDCGSGLRGLGFDLLKKGFGKGGESAHIFISHTHWDHIQGIPFFVPIFIPSNTIHFYSCTPNIKERLVSQQTFDYFPVPFAASFGAKVTVDEVKESEPLMIDDVKISFKKLFHPNDAWATKVECGGKIFVYTADSEYNMMDSGLADVINFFKDADLIVMDTMYTAEESWNKLTWGHSSPNVCVDIASRAHAKQMALFHYDHATSDETIYEEYLKVLEYQKVVRPNDTMKIFSAWEGLEITL